MYYTAIDTGITSYANDKYDVRSVRSGEGREYEFSMAPNFVSSASSRVNF